MTKKENTTIRLFDKYARAYDKMQPLIVPYYNDILSIIADAYEHYVGKGTFLDLGCGTGNLSSNILKESPRSKVYLLDGSRSMLEIASRKITKRFGKTAVLGHNSVNFEDKSWDKSIDLNRKFDAIVSTFVLEHLKGADYKNVIEKSYCHLKPGGSLILLEFSDNKHGLKDWMYSKLKSRGEKHSQCRRIIEESAREEKHYFIDIQKRLDWIRKAGYKNVHTIWQYLFGYIVVGSK